MPLDAELSLGADSYSDMLREMGEYLGVYGVYHKVADVLERFFGLQLSTRTLQHQVLTDAEEVLSYYEQKPAPYPDEEAEVLVLQADGKGVPIIAESAEPPSVRLGKGQKRGRKKEAIVTTAYTITAAPRRLKLCCAAITTFRAPLKRPNLSILIRQRRTNMCGQRWKARIPR
jgi:hypothetical protein